MRREWEPEDLIASWTLLPGDVDLLVNKSGATRLGFALLLKFFEIEARFPRFPAEVALLAVHFVAQQVRVDPSAWESYDWQGRSVKAHRVQIRKRFNFRECSLGDQDKLIAWLAAEVCPIEQRSDQLRDALVARCRLISWCPQPAVSWTVLRPRGWLPLSRLSAARRFCGSPPPARECSKR